MTQVKAVHRTFEEKAKGQREMTLYISDGDTVSRLSGTKALKLIDTWTPGTVRFSDVKSADAVLLALHERGVRIMHAHWHRTGIAKGSSPEEIVASLASLPDQLFTQFVPDAKIAELRNAVSMRNALNHYRDDASRRLLQVARNLGTPSREDVVDDSLLAAFEDLDGMAKEFRYVDDNGKATAWDTRIAAIAKTIPACQTFARVACVESLGTAAAFIAAINGIERFESVAGLWRFCGQHVVDGKSPKRAKGKPSDWSPTAKAVLWNLGVSIQKRNANPWNAAYRQIKEHELSVHAQKCPGCKTPAGHCDARARRRMIKEILKRFYLEAKGERVLGQCLFENQYCNAEKPQAIAKTVTTTVLPAANIVSSPDQFGSENQKSGVRAPQAKSWSNPKVCLPAAKIETLPDQLTDEYQLSSVRERHPTTHSKTAKKSGAA